MALPQFVVKKDGHITRFRRTQLKDSLLKTADHIGFKDANAIEEIFEATIQHLKRIKKDKIDVEEIREAIVEILKERKLKKLEDAYDLTFLHIYPLHIQKVLKRNGKATDFHPYKIFKALTKIFQLGNIENSQKAQLLTEEIVHRLEEISFSTTPTTLDIKKIVEEVLKEYNLTKALDLYRSHRYM